MREWTKDAEAAGASASCRTFTLARCGAVGEYGPRPGRAGRSGHFPRWDSRAVRPVRTAASRLASIASGPKYGEWLP